VWIKWVAEYGKDASKLLLHLRWLCTAIISCHATGQTLHINIWQVHCNAPLAELTPINMHLKGKPRVGFAWQA
jgi:hypothetical protein